MILLPVSRLMIVPKVLIIHFCVKIPQQTVMTRYTRIKLPKKLMRIYAQTAVYPKAVKINIHITMKILAVMVYMRLTRKYTHTVTVIMHILMTGILTGI